jgi:hypothetical protein
MTDSNSRLAELEKANEALERVKKGMLEKAREAREGVKEALRLAFQHAIECGEILRAAKKGSPYGGSPYSGSPNSSWADFLNYHGEKVRTAEKYIRIAENRSLIEAAFKIPAQADFLSEGFFRQIRIMPQDGMVLFATLRYPGYAGPGDTTGFGIAPSVAEPGCYHVALENQSTGWVFTTGPCKASALELHDIPGTILQGLWRIPVIPVDEWLDEYPSYADDKNPFREYLNSWDD